jgi:serine/threonine protein phosphatase PrpC
MKLISSGFSHIGHVRQWNEDAFLNVDELGLYALADGLGGMPCGKMASNQVIEYLASWFAQNHTNFQPTPDAWRQLWEQLNRSLKDRVIEEDIPHPVATTLALLYIQQSTAWWSHLGDSRIYRLRNQHLQRLTRDHTLLEKYIDNPQDPDVSELPEDSLRHTLTRCLGSDQQFDAEVVADTVLPGDRFLLCSDGVWWPLGDNRIQQTLSDHATPEAAVLSIEQEVLDLDGTDNLSAVVIHVQE